MSKFIDAEHFPRVLQSYGSLKVRIASRVERQGDVYSLFSTTTNAEKQCVFGFSRRNRYDFKLCPTIFLKSSLFKDWPAFKVVRKYSVELA